MDSTALAHAFAKLLGDHVRVQVLRESLPPYWRAEMAELRAWPLDGLRALWDEYDGGNAPLGFEGETIHAALNERGDGAYCAV